MMTMKNAKKKLNEVEKNLKYVIENLVSFNLLLDICTSKKKLSRKKNALCYTQY
jgi:hypothetical protein